MKLHWRLTQVTLVSHFSLYLGLLFHDELRMLLMQMDVG
jgi:hypothetical protein